MPKTFRSDTCKRSEDIRIFDIRISRCPDIWIRVNAASIFQVVFKEDVLAKVSAGPSHGNKEWGGPSENQLGVQGGAVSPPSGVRGSAPGTFEKHVFFNNSLAPFGDIAGFQNRQAESTHYSLWLHKSASFSYKTLFLYNMSSLSAFIFVPSKFHVVLIFLLLIIITLGLFVLCVCVYLFCSV